MTDHAQALSSKINDRSALVGIIGLGYVGLPLALAFTEKGFNVIGFDVDQVKVDKINSGDCYIKHLDCGRVEKAVTRKTLEATADFTRLAEPDAILVETMSDLAEAKRWKMAGAEKLAEIVRWDRSNDDVAI